MLTRKIFLRQLVGGGMTAMLWGCGGGGESDEASVPASGCGNFGITANHGHVLSIPDGDLDAPGDKVYSIQGGAPHDHLLTLSAAQRVQLKAGQSIQVRAGPSMLDGHVHDVSGTCR